VEGAGNRIVGGVSAQPGMEPWLGAFRSRNVRCRFLGEGHQAGGSLISKCWMVTG